MKNKQTIAIIIIVLAIAVIVIAGYKILTSYMWSEDGTVEDGKTEIIQRIKSEEDYTKKEEQVKILLEANKITQKEADELLEK